MKLLLLVVIAVVAASCSEAKRFQVLQGPLLTYAKWAARCRARGGRLASINSPAEQRAAVRALRATKHRSVLTGMRRIAPHKKFVNGARRRLPFSHWNRGEPNDYGRGEQCVELYTIRSIYGRWNDIACRGRAAMCQFSSKTFKVVSDHGRRHCHRYWQHWCRVRGGHLARVNNAGEQRAAYKVIRRCRRHSVMIDCKRKSRGSRIFQVSSGRRITYANWNRGEPNNWRHQEQCTEIYRSSGKWNDIKCSVAAALCQFRRSRHHRHHFKGHKWHHRRVRYHYIILHSSRALSDRHWQHKCRRKGGRLASIPNARAQARVRAVLRKARRSSVLIGIKRVKRHCKTFVDSRRRRARYFNWNRGEPNDCCGGEACVEVYTRGSRFGKWNDIKCRGHAALCEIRRR